MSAPDQIISDAELREHYAQTGLARLGLPFDRALRSEAIRIALAGAAKAAHRVAARHARAAAITYHLPQEAA